MVRATWVLWMCGLWGLAACTADPAPLDWEVRFAPESLKAETVLVQARILRDGCEGTAIYDTTVVLGNEGAGTLPPVLAPGIYGFYGRASNLDCAWHAEGCVTVELPRNGPVVVQLTGLVTPDRVCEPGSCDGGVCLDVDCPPGFGNCDDTPANGCETDLTRHPDHCGACGNACGEYEQCDGGTCVPACTRKCIRGTICCPSNLCCAFECPGPDTPREEADCFPAGFLR